ncbi:condensation domain-containing protein [Streptomyces sp. NPDC004579]|uniref:condensation domain-containing protein n=1 Tax=Streptomyces sp. NPDC004579 TaxID=3154667 RepID=UPI0033BE444E
MNGEGPAGVCAVIDPEQGDHGTMELHGIWDTAFFHRALHRVAESGRGVRHPGCRLVAHGEDLHTVELPGGRAAPAPAAVGLLADLLTAAPEPRPGTGPAAAAAGQPCRTLPRTGPVTPLQQQRLADAVAWPGHQVEQILWRWHGPLDPARFEAAWHAVGERESVLRTAFVWDPRPRAVVFDRALSDVVRHPHRTVTRRAVLPARERARAFDLRRPAAVRLALLDSGPGDAAAPFTDVLLTYHRALLDSWSVRLLMRECCRAYLAGGTLPGGERRPDLGDCARRLAAQDPGPAPGARQEPAHRPALPPPGPVRPADSGRHAPAHRPTVPPPGPAPDARQGPAHRPGEPPPPVRPPGHTTTGMTAGAATGPGTGMAAGTGVLRGVLSPARSTRLTHWAARWGVAESSVLQAVWALLLYRARDIAPAPAIVGFGLDFPGRGLLLDGIEGIPGPFENTLPLNLTVDPALTLPHLLRTLRDAVMDLSAYEWTTPAPARTRGPRAGGLLAFDCGPNPETAYGHELAAHGIRLEEQEAAGAPAGYALRLRAGHDTRRALVLTCAYDRDLIDDSTARTLLAHTVRMLRLLPVAATAATTVADVLAWMPRTPTPPVPDGPAARDTAPLLLLRGTPAPATATVCLLDTPGAPHTGHRELLRHYRGPETLTALRPTAGPPAARTDALVRLARAGGRLVLGGYSGTGALACELAHQVTLAGVRPPLVVVGGPDGDPHAPRGLAAALQRASASAARP